MIYGPLQVEVLRAGRYNGPDHRAQEAQSGDVITVAGGPYGESLIADGFVRPVEAQAEPEPEPQVETTADEGQGAGLADMSVADLRQMARAMGVDPLPRKKADLIAAIEAQAAADMAQNEA